MKIVTFDRFQDTFVALKDNDNTIFQHSLSEYTSYSVPAYLLSVVTKDFGHRVYSEYLKDNYNNLDENSSEDMIASFLGLCHFNTSTGASSGLIKAAVNDNEQWIVDYLEVLDWYQYDIAEGELFGAIASEIFGIDVDTYMTMYSDDTATLSMRQSKTTSLVFFYLDGKLIAKTDIVEDYELIPKAVLDFLESIHGIAANYFSSINSYFYNKENYINADESVIDTYYSLLPLEKAEKLLVLLESKFFDTDIEFKDIEVESKRLLH